MTETNNEHDMALAALKAAAEEVGQGLPEDLLNKAYAIQRRHQFDRPDQREMSLQEMSRLVDQFVESDGVAR